MGAYGIKTAGLNLAARGAYDALLDYYYTKERPLPKDKRELYRIVRAFERWERAAVDSVLAKFFSLTDAGYTNPRAEEELAKYKKAADIHRANGSRHTSKLLPNRNLKPMEILEARNQIKTKSRGAPAALTAPPDWIPREPWDGFVKLRQELRKRITPQQMERMIEKLAKVRDSGGSIEAVLDYSVSNGYCGLFPERGFANSRGSSPQVKRETMAGSGLEIPESVMVRPEYLERVRQRQEKTAKNLFQIAARNDL